MPEAAGPSWEAQLQERQKVKRPEAEAPRRSLKRRTGQRMAGRWVGPVEPAHALQKEAGEDQVPMSRLFPTWGFRSILKGHPLKRSIT